ncbi:MAG: M20/M25/M40 family metallo-hydrolase [Anaerolineales bacterium]|nr:M20/M25/M40 family metallo-hydrolase [Anaerolineales bacterium]
MRDPLALIRQERIVELAEVMIAIPSVTGAEEAMADWVYAFLANLGLRDLQRLAVEEAGDSIVGFWGGDSGPTLVLNFHLDTFAVCAGWQTDPFVPVRQGSRLYGLGSHDMIGGAACVLAAVEALVQSGRSLNGKLIVSATSDEENWSRGAHALIASGLLAGCAACLIPEPTPAGALHVGFRGRHVIRVRLFGKTIHAAFDDDDGINAVTEAARLVAELDKLTRADYGYNEPFNMYGNLVVTSIQGGSTMILVPERADVIVDWHPLPGAGPDVAVQLIEAASARAGLRGRVEISWDERPTPAPAGYQVPLDHPFTRIVTANMVKELDRSVHYLIGRSVNDASHFAVHGGIPTLVYGPQGGNTCAANEYLDVTTLEPVARTYLRTVLDYLGG